jgi:hypothetical protein
MAGNKNSAGNRDRELRARVYSPPLVFSLVPDLRRTNRQNHFPFSFSFLFLFFFKFFQKLKKKDKRKREREKEKERKRKREREREKEKERKRELSFYLPILSYLFSIFKVRDN